MTHPIYTTTHQTEIRQRLIDAARSLNPRPSVVQNPPPISVAIVGKPTVDMDVQPKTALEAAAKLFAYAYADLLGPAPSQHAAVAKTWSAHAVSPGHGQTVVLEDLHAIVATQPFRGDDVGEWAALKASVDLIWGGLMTRFPDHVDLRQAAALRSFRSWLDDGKVNGLVDHLGIKGICNYHGGRFSHNEYRKAIATATSEFAEANALPSQVAEYMSRRIQATFAFPDNLSGQALRDTHDTVSRLLAGHRSDRVADRVAFVQAMIDPRHTHALTPLRATKGLVEHLLLMVSEEIGKNPEGILVVTERTIALRNLLRKPVARMSDTEVDAALAVISFGQEPLDFSVITDADVRAAQKRAVVTWALQTPWADDAVTTITAEYMASREMLLQSTRTTLSLYPQVQGVAEELVELHSTFGNLLNDPKLSSSGAVNLVDRITAAIQNIVKLSETLGEINHEVLANVRSGLLGLRIALADLEAELEGYDPTVEAASTADASAGQGEEDQGNQDGGASDEGNPPPPSASAEPSAPMDPWQQPS